MAAPNHRVEGSFTHWQRGSVSRRPGATTWICGLLLCGFSCLIAVSRVPAQTTPDWTQYNVPFPPPPPDGSTAAATFTARRNQELEYLACGSENVFLGISLDALNKLASGATQDGLDDLTGDGYLGMVMAKLEWLKIHPTGCDNPVPYTVAGVFYDPNNFKDEATMESVMAQTFGSDCSNSPGLNNAIENASGTSGTNPLSYITVSSQVSAACLKAEINFALSRVQEGDRFPGTDKLPCFSATPATDFEHFKIKFQPGDWDAKMKSLIRILFLDKPIRIGGNSILSSLPAPSGFSDDQNLRGYIQNELITVDGPPGEDTVGYKILGCGDHEKDTGSAQDREDENDFWNNFWKDIKGILCWLKIALAGAAALAAAGIAANVLALGALAQALGAAALLAGTIPETENHQLMIESTRFLNNQIIIETLGPDNSSGTNVNQSLEKNWLLGTFQQIAEHDFREYNARPYTAYSLTALRNLADFSTDVDVKNGAQMLLEYSGAKFALGSNQGRRLVPFRRRLPAVKCILGAAHCDECYTNGCANPWFEIFHPKAYEDHEVSLGLLFNGQTQQLFGGMVALDGLDAPAATTRFLFDSPINDLAIRKEGAYYQTIHHAGYEIYSSSPNALIMAGGIETGHADNFTIGGISTPFHFGDDPNQDIGGGLPTTVMLTGSPGRVTAPQGQSRMTIGDFITFQGNLKTEGSDESFDDNLCVWNNFACGINVQVPLDITRCLQPSSDFPHHWFFFDSSNSQGVPGCDGYKPRPGKFYFVLYLLCPQNNCENNLSGVPPNSAGFLEVFDNPSDAFSTFQGKVVGNNPFNSSGNIEGLGHGCLTGDNCDGHYHTVSGHDLELDLRGHQDDSDKTGITSVDGIAVKDLDDWDFLDGDILTSKGDGVILIKNPLLGWHIVLDFSDVNHPCRRQDPGSTCLPPL
jgi:hypothetical protein